MTAIKIVIFGLIIGSVVALSGVGYYHYELARPVVEVDAQYTVEIKSGASFTAISNQLISKGIIDDAWIFKLYGRISGLSGKVKAGEYLLDGPLTIPQLVAVFVSGASIQYPITFVEGWTFGEVLSELSKHKKLTQVIAGKDSIDVLRSVTDLYDHPEGLFFPDTYQYQNGDTDLSVLVRSYNRMQKVLAEEWDGRAKNLPLKTPYDALILASIVERETGKASEREEIAGVFVRRLKRGMRLQTDPTVIYGLGDEYKGNITRAHLRQFTPYNTYRINGLPPTPIAMPGREAIHAAVNPDNGQTIYFVAKGDGSHYFSKTLKEHTNAVNKYQIRQRKKKYRSTE